MGSQSCSDEAAAQARPRLITTKLASGSASGINSRMPTLIPKPTRIQAAGNKPKTIEEFIGRVNSGHAQISVAHMRSPGGWVEPGQTPEFEEYTLVLAGMLRVESRDGSIDVQAGQAVIAHAGEWVRYSSPEPEGADYIAICLPAFSPNTVHRDE
jgi:mannose-6-phosphate isomerase-like protein (cupin superfamily)